MIAIPPRCMSAAASPSRQTTLLAGLGGRCPMLSGWRVPIEPTVKKSRVVPLFEFFPQSNTSRRVFPVVDTINSSFFKCFNQLFPVFLPAQGCNHFQILVYTGSKSPFSDGQWRKAWCVFDVFKGIFDFLVCRILFGGKHEIRDLHCL